MKKNMLLLGLLVLIAGCVIYVPREYVGDDPYTESRSGYDYQGSRFADELGLNYFYGYLDPYGFWTRLSPYSYVWIPHSTAYGWRPYTSGRWFWTDHGWTWASSHDWGWACFHYGRWGWDAALGWYWAPGTVWGPAWVAWRYGPGHIGWAPLPPDVRFERGVGISSLPHPLSERSWVFVEDRYFYAARVSPHILPPERNLTFVQASQLKADISVQGDRILNRGLDVSRVSDLIGERIREQQLRPSQSPGRSEAHTGFLYVYSPRVIADETSAPPRVTEPPMVSDRVIEQKMENYREQGERPVEDEIQQLQTRELKELEKSQQREVERLDRQTREEMRKAETETDKAKIDRESREQKSRIKARQETEKAKITKRHSEEREKVSESAVSKKKKK
ncbi:MAG: DUF6600 domain-containing protein [Candidatus Aminicenantaceae bacterium]